MQANVVLKTKEAVFPSGTVGGGYLWQLVETEELAGPVTINAAPVEKYTTEPFVSFEVEAERTYKVSGSRVDPNKEILGQVVSTSFTTEAEPEDVIIQVADTLTVEIV